jgi:hypothetical protein
MNTIAERRQHFLFLGCLAHAALVGIGFFFLREGPGAVVTYSLWWGLFLTWPAWTFVLWRYGSKKPGSVILPMLLGLLILSPALMILFIFISVSLRHQV